MTFNPALLTFNRECSKLQLGRHSTNLGQDLRSKAPGLLVIFRTPVVRNLETIQLSIQIC